MAGLTPPASPRLDWRINELLAALDGERNALLDAVTEDTDRDTMPLWQELGRNAETRKELEEILDLRRQQLLTRDDFRYQSILLAFDMGQKQRYGYRPPVKQWPGSDLAGGEPVTFGNVDWDGRILRFTDDEGVSPLDAL